MGLIPLIEAIEENLTQPQAEERETYWINRHLDLGAQIFNVNKAKRHYIQTSYPADPKREGWSPMTEAAEEVKVKPGKISRLALQGKIQTRVNPFDERTKLVNIEEVRRYFGLDR